MSDKEVYIFDTDMDTDCDDVGALTILLKYAKKGLIDLKAIVTDAPSVGGAPICEMLCNYYSYHCDIGAIYERQYQIGESDRYVEYRNHRNNNLSDTIFYNRHLLHLINKKDEDYEPSYKVYRKALSSCEDKSVTVIAVGFYTAIYELFQSGADEYSDLNGFDLFNKKVKKVVSMGNIEDVKGDFNFKMDFESAYNFVNRVDVPVYYSPDGMDVITGYDFADKLEKDNPLRLAYEIYNGGPNKGRMSWDLIATYFSLGIDDSIFKLNSNGRMKLEENKDSEWIHDDKRVDWIIHLNIPAQEMEKRLEYLLTDY